jgi:hypothetical protein
LLIAVPKGKLDDLTSRFKKAKEDFWVVGEATEGSGVEVAP